MALLGCGCGDNCMCLRALDLDLTDYRFTVAIRMATNIGFEFTQLTRDESLEGNEPDNPSPWWVFRLNGAGVQTDHPSTSYRTACFVRIHESGSRPPRVMVLTHEGADYPEIEGPDDFDLPKDADEKDENGWPLREEDLPDGAEEHAIAGYAGAVWVCRPRAGWHLLAFKEPTADAQIDRGIRFQAATVAGVANITDRFDLLDDPEEGEEEPPDTIPAAKLFCAVKRVTVPPNDPSEPAGGEMSLILTGMNGTFALFGATWILSVDNTLTPDDHQTGGIWALRGAGKFLPGRAMRVTARLLEPAPAEPPTDPPADPAPRPPNAPYAEVHVECYTGFTVDPIPWYLPWAGEFGEGNLVQSYSFYARWDSAAAQFFGRLTSALTQFGNNIIANPFVGTPTHFAVVIEDLNLTICRAMNDLVIGTDQLSAPLPVVSDFSAIT